MLHTGCSSKGKIMNNDACTARKREVLSSIVPHIVALVKAHEASQRLWYPADYLVYFEPGTEISRAARAALVYNMLTEEGLPNFHRLLAEYMGNAPHWVEWTNLWTAEEDRHGVALRNFLTLSQCVDMRVVDRMQYSFLRKGFYPEWGGDPYKLLAYTVLQEKATQVSHKNVASLVSSQHMQLAGMLGKIAGEEGKHHVVYRGVFREVMERDPEGAIEALCDVMYHFEMPGAHIPGFKEYAHLARVAHIFGPEEYLKIVKDTTEDLGVRHMLLVGNAAKAQERILLLPKIFERQIMRLGKDDTRAMRFDFLGDTILSAV